MELKKNYSIKTGYNNMDIQAIHQFLCMESYWAKGISKELVEKALQHSFCVGVFLADKQIGFARLITDYTTFAYLADVYILEQHRGEGLSKKLATFGPQQLGGQGLLKTPWFPPDRGGETSCGESLVGLSALE